MLAIRNHRGRFGWSSVVSNDGMVGHALNLDFNAEQSEACGLFHKCSPVLEIIGDPPDECFIKR